MFLEDGCFQEADNYCEKVLDMNPENGVAYVYKLMIHFRVCKIEDLAMVAHPLENVPYYKMVMRFAGEGIKQQLMAYNNQIKQQVSQRIQQLTTQQQTLTEKQQQIWESQQNYNSKLHQQRIEELKGKRKKYLGFGFLFLFLFWPVSIALFILYSKAGKELENLLP